MDTMTIFCIAGAAFSLGVLVYLILDVPLAQAPENGARGVARAVAREKGGFGPFEAILRLLATHASKLPLSKQRKELDTALTAAGEMKGLTPDEILVLIGLSGLAGVLSGYYFFVAVDSTYIALACVILGPLLPAMQLKSNKKDRCKEVSRGLPAAIDLAALCMGAGLDFPGAIAHVVNNMRDMRSPVRQELERVLQELSLGRTRKQALQSFAERVQTDAVKEFVSAVVQAEEKGTPLSEVLAVQAGALRGRRSVLAEEAAARAGVLLMLPMLLMMVSISLLLMGPLLIEMSQGGMM